MLLRVLGRKRKVGNVSPANAVRLDSQPKQSLAHKITTALLDASATRPDANCAQLPFYGLDLDCSRARASAAVPDQAGVWTGSGDITPIRRGIPD